MAIEETTIKRVISYCNRDLIPDNDFNNKTTYPSEWFQNYFGFVNDAVLQRHLGEAYYQARFTYKIMSCLRLPLAKNKSFVKFQIIQYASICEALLDFALDTFHKEDSKNAFAIKEYVPFPNAVSKSTKITFDNDNLVLCKVKKKQGVLKRTRIDNKIEYAIKNGIITQEIGDKMNSLYEQRNNIHILKAATTNYSPKLRESKEAFLLMQAFTEAIKKYCLFHAI